MNVILIKSVGSKIFGFVWKNRNRLYYTAFGSVKMNHRKSRKKNLCERKFSIINYYTTLCTKIIKKYLV